MIKKFENFKKSNHLIKEAFYIGLGSSYRKRIESVWGLTMEDLEDILIEISDLSLYPCRINEPSYNKYSSSSLIVLSSVTGIDISEYKSIVHRIFVELSKYNIDMEDKTLDHPKTNVERGKYFFCLTLTKNPWGGSRPPM
jgi:hypothetical protein